MNLRRRWTTGLVCAALATALYAADEKPAGEAKKPEEAKGKSEAPKAESSSTDHSITIDGKAIAYIATAGTAIVRNDKDEPWASMGYIAYVKKDVPDSSRRPLTFAYNGGPGSASIWLHMGVLGPRRIVTADATPTPPPPYQIVDNTESILDRTDLVMIDPVGTGLSHAAGEAKDKDFWGVDPDIESISRFIAQYVSDNNRWNSPKYLLGESYGTTRSAGIVDYLQSRSNMAFNGVILVSVVLDLGATFNSPGNDRPFPFFLPTYAAVAWYHKALPNRPEKLEPFLDEVRKFALGPYATALLAGGHLAAADRSAVLAKLHEYTGLSVEYLDKSDLRVPEPAFTQELLRQHREVVGRLDARFTGFMFDPLEKDADEDPQSNAIGAAYTAAFMDYLHRDLKFGMGKTYIVSGRLGRQWDWSHQAPGARFPLRVLPNTALDLAHALGTNPNLRVLTLNGYFDLATPFLGTESTIAHLELDATLLSHVEFKYYQAGHMMYVHDPDRVAMKRDVAEFIDRTSRTK